MIVAPNQSMADIAIMASGALESIFQLAQANGKSITDIPIPGDNYFIPAGLTSDTDTLQYLYQNNIVTGTMGTPLGTGIGYWRIEINFTVS